ncbi:MAG TPA: tryptophan-rich sensory protein [Gemmatimonas aurantiaca]|uniref:Tryptophan-rich sensory protein n=2 Tax=Gemmatimonas aurantiaca TaxID=173480 RepID=A0A3D4V9X2_9BACT|nr:TspO/MBR family protein [Gemmatimonas aurantiaca]BAH40366.1 putative tryptophan-rich sensory protein [Gemmatimonas aurantiaca T-27]HCT57624.1 tryptophan-rich sensory protein [Gemmatimonas aurantiaca]
MTKSRSVPALIVWLIVCFAAAYIGAMATRDAPTFYAQLSLATWAPPASVFGPVWTVLYAMMAVAAWMVWERRPAPGADTAIRLFVVQLAVNALWSWVFFAWHRGALAFLNIVVLWILIVVTIVLFKRVKPTAALLLAPYLAWVSFATALAYSAWQRNPGLL